MKTIKGPALFLAQFAGDEAPFNSWDSITKWAADCGYKGVQVPSWDGRLFDLAKAAESKDPVGTHGSSIWPKPQRARPTAMSSRGRPRPMASK